LQKLLQKFDTTVFETYSV